MVLARRSADSRASSLGPSDSVSQHKIDLTIEKAIEDLLERVEPPPVRPRYLPESVLWYYGDYKNDTSEGITKTDLNKSRPRMSLAMRRPDGTMISSQELTTARCAAEVVVESLVKAIKESPNYDRNSKFTKTWIRTAFSAEYQAALLKLEAQQPLLRLCAAHWKAEAMICSVLARRKEPQEPQEPQPPVPSRAALTTGVWDTAPTKRALELSPGPKSPSASHTQKRSKDGMPSRQKNPAPSNNSE